MDTPLGIHEASYKSLSRIECEDDVSLLDNIISWKYKIIGMRKRLACWCKGHMTRRGSKFKSH